MRKIHYEEKVNAYIYIFSLLFAIVTSFFYAFTIDFNKPRFVLILLPISYALISIVFNRNLKGSGIIRALLHILFLVRMVICPFIWGFNIDSSFFYSSSATDDALLIAIFLIIYEYVCVQLTIFCYDGRHASQNRIYIEEQNEVNLSQYYTNDNMFRLIIGFLIAYAIVLYVSMPVVRTGFKTIFMINSADFTRDLSEEISGGIIKKALCTLFALDIQILRVLLPSYVLFNLRKRGARITGVALLLLCFSQFLFISSTFAETIVADATIIVFYMSLYPSKKKRIFLILLLSVVGVSIMFFAIRFTITEVGAGLYSRTQGKMYYYGQILNGYFQGADGVAAAVALPYKGNWIESMVSAIIRAIPFNSTIFSGFSGERLTSYYDAYYHTKGQIIPTIGAGHYYFSFIGAPIFSIILSNLAMKYEAKAAANKGSMKFVSYFFCAIVFALGVGAKSVAITLRWYLSWGVFLIMITHFACSIKYARTNKTDFTRE